MPLVQITMWEGTSLEAKKRIVEGVTRVFEELGIPRDGVEIIIYEVSKENWAHGGQLHAERHPGRRPP